VLRNTAYLGLAEVLSGPLSVLLNAFIGRYLGPTKLGHMYFATTLCAAVILFVNWGHHGPLSAEVAIDRTRAGKLLGTSMAFRSLNSVLAFSILVGTGAAFGFDLDRRWAIALVFIGSAFTTLLNACLDVMRGFERTDVAAYTRVGMQLLATGLVIPVLIFGGGLRMTLLVQALVAATALTLMLRSLKGLGVDRLGWDRALVKKLTVDGTPFVFFQLVLVLQPNIDAFYLAQLAPAEVIGWYAVSQRLAGVLLIPATALVGSLYPTLCRLNATNQAGYRQLIRDSVGMVSALYPDIGVSIFGREAFRPAEDTLRFFAIQLFLVYFSMPLGTAIIASGRQRTWTAVQVICLINSLLLAPILIRHFQKTTGNGGAGLPVAAAVSETLMVGVGLWLLPRGLFDRSLLKSLSLAAVAGFGMAGTAYGLRQISEVSFLTAPFAVLAYALLLYWTGVIRPEQLAAVQGVLRRKLKGSAR
jgi:O-antigen/teichoic acid export membrane protein